jgi:hypothetical protein
VAEDAAHYHRYCSAYFAYFACLHNFHRPHRRPHRCHNPQFDWKRVHIPLLPHCFVALSPLYFDSVVVVVAAADLPRLVEVFVEILHAVVAHLGWREHSWYFVAVVDQNQLLVYLDRALCFDVVIGYFDHW